MKEKKKKEKRKCQAKKLLVNMGLTVMFLHIKPYEGRATKRRSTE